MKYYVSSLTLHCIRAALPAGVTEKLFKPMVRTIATEIYVDKPTLCNDFYFDKFIETNDVGYQNHLRVLMDVNNRLLDLYLPLPPANLIVSRSGYVIARLDSNSKWGVYDATLFNDYFSPMYKGKGYREIKHKSILWKFAYCCLRYQPNRFKHKSKSDPKTAPFYLWKE